MKPENLRCPDCGGEMVPRTNKAKGTQFWGCKAFPQCRGTRDNEGRSKADRQREREEEESDRELMSDGGLLDRRPSGFRRLVE